MKKTILFLFLIIILTVGTYLFIRLEVFTNSLKYLAQSQLTAAVGHPVKIEKVNWIPVNKIIFKKVTFTGFSCDKIELAFNLKKIGKGIKAVNKITLILPEISLSNIEKLLTRKTSVTPKTSEEYTNADIYVNNGTVFADNFTIRKIYIKAKSEEDKFSVKTALVFSSNGSLEKDRLSGRLHLSGNIKKNLDEISLKGDLKEIVFRQISPFNGLLNITGGKKKLDISGNIISDDAIIKVKSALNPSSKDYAVTTQLDGTISDLRIFTDKIIDFKQYALFRHVPAGPLSFKGKFELPEARLKLDMKQFPVKRTENLMHIQKIETELIYSENEWVVNSTATLLASLSGSKTGNIILEGKIKDRIIDFLLVGNNLKVKNRDINSDFSFDAKMSGEFGDPKIVGNLKLNEIALRDDSPKSGQGKFLWQDNKGKLSLKGKDLSVLVSATNTEILNSKIKYGMTNIGFSGKFNNINFKVVNIDSILLDKRVSGFIDVSGYIKDIFSPDQNLYADFSSPHVTINESSTSVSGIISYSKDKIHIQNLSLSGLSGSAMVLLNEKRTSGRLVFSKCDSNLILPFLNIGPEILIGTISGKIIWNGPMENPNPHGTILITRGSILKNVPYDLIVTSFKTKLSKLMITEFVMQQKPAETSFRLSGEIEKNNFRLSIELDELAFVNRAFGGNLTISGKKTWKGMKYKIISPSLIIDNVSEKFVANGTYDNEKIELDKIAWGNKIKGGFTYFTDSKYISSNIDFNFDLEDFFKENITGKTFGELTVRGNVNKPLILIDGNYRGSIYNLDTRGSGKLFISNNILKIEESKFLVNGSKTEVSGALDLKKREFLGMNISAENVGTDLIYGLLKTSLSLSGILRNIEMNITDSFNSPKITVNFFGTNMHIEDKKVDSIDSKFVLKDKRIEFLKGSVKWGETEIKILPETFVSFTKETIFKIVSEIRNLKLPGVAIFGGATLDGRWSPHDIVKADISTSGLWINQLKMKDTKHYIEYSRGILHFIPEMSKHVQITGIIDFSKAHVLKIDNFSVFTGGKRLFFVNGFQKGDDFEIISEGADIPLGNLLNLFDLKVAAEGNTNFNIKISGNKKDPKITCMLNSNRGKIENVGFDVAAVFFQVNNYILELKHLRISQKDIYSVEGEGMAPLPLTSEARKRLSKQPIDISLKIKNGDLKILPAISKVVKKAKGQFTTSVDVKGTLEKPDVSGMFSADADTIVMQDIFKKLKKVKCRIEFSGNKVDLKELSAIVGKDPIILNGYVKLIEGFNVSNFDFNLLTPEKGGVAVVVNELQIKSGGVEKVVPIALDTGISRPSKIRISVNTRFFGVPEAWNIDGYMKLSKGKFTYPGEEGEEGAWDFLENADWNLKILAGKNCWYENEFASVEIKGELLLHGKGVSPLVTGKVEAIRGELDYLGRNFTIIEAIFDADKSDLYLSGLAEAETQIEKRREDAVTHQMITEYIPEVVILRLDRGPLEDVKPKFYSKTDPKIDERTAAQAAMGLADTREKQPFSPEEMTKTVDTFLTTPFVKSLLKRTGFIDRFSMKRETTTQQRETSASASSDEGQPSLMDLYKGTKIQFGKSFSRGFAAGYGVKFDEIDDRLSLKHEVEISYRLRSGILFETSQELEKDGVREFFMKKYWRFDTAPQKD
ncbi:MAG: hypothetical protein JW983_10580 [Elusimicrobia bacterium]|nr:hypothetical protein [Elusimicrobiota bacterium]